jgi:tRNA-dihydrouridine synthase
LILDHFALLVEQEDPETVLHKMRTFTGWYTHGLPDGRRLRSRIHSLATAADFRAALDDYFRGAAAAAA